MSYHTKSLIHIKFAEHLKHNKLMNNRLFLNGSFIYPSTAGLIDDMTCKYIYNNQ